MFHEDKFAFLEKEPAIQVSCRKAAQKSLLKRLRETLAESAPALSMEEIRDQVAPDQMFAASLACLIFRIVRGKREE